MRPLYDIIVIGSGFGGAITACRLAQAGRSVCILEKGRRWNMGEFPRSPAEVSRGIWRDGKSFGLLDYRCFKRIDVIQGCGVGGGSLHYFNVHLRTPPQIFEQPCWPAEVKRHVLDPYYSLAEDMLDSRPLTPPAGFGLPARTQAFSDAANALGRKPELVPIGVHTGSPAPNRHSGIEQAPCDYSGDCLLGCQIHAKNSLDLNYIAVAERNGAEVYPLHLVHRLEPLSQGGYRVHFSRFDPADALRSEPGFIDATVVVVAAGTLGSNELLLRCRAERTLPQISPALGTRFSGNGDFLLAGTLDANRDIDPARGPSITVGADFSTADNKILIEDLGFPEPFIWMLEGAVPRARRVRSLATAIAQYVADTIGSGRVNFEAERLFRGGVTTRFLPYLAMGTDAADGRIRLKNGCVDIEWSHRRSRQLFREIEAALKQLSTAIGGKYVTSILWGWPLRKLLTAHPLGGCYMGSDPQRSVTDHRGQVWGCPNLYVADGSLIPSALSVNPSLTISALAERVAFWMIKGREMNAGERVTAGAASLKS